ncbi:MAG: TetR/AcrR family transcriptional regulator [Candidatus Eisenbacteria sp.]|nr:TetR/AcrR family transcriptional regulator [Candidatus Eisenbacteria bacterium]
MVHEESRKTERSDRRAREKLARREDILAAARKVFAAKGYHEAALDEIAAEAGFSKGALYGYFESKEDLYATVLEEEFEQVNAVIRRAMEEHQDPRDVLREAIRLKFQQHAERKELFAEIGKGQARLLTSPSSESDPKWRLMNRFKTKFFTGLDLLAEVIESGIRAGKLRGDIPSKQLAMSLLGLVHANFFYWLVKSEQEPIDAVSDRVVRLFLDGVSSRMEDQQ